jgi:hypothetical protein
MAAVELHAVDNPTADTENAVVVVAEAQHWNRPRANVYRVVAACYSFVVLGLNDAAYGVWSSLPHCGICVYFGI